jgi:hypothetical protein
MLDIHGHPIQVPGLQPWKRLSGLRNEVYADEAAASENGFQMRSSALVGVSHF